MQILFFFSFVQCPILCLKECINYEVQYLIENVRWKQSHENTTVIPMEHTYDTEPY